MEGLRRTETESLLPGHGVPSRRTDRDGGSEDGGEGEGPGPLRGPETGVGQGPHPQDGDGRPPVPLVPRVAARGAVSAHTLGRPVRPGRSAPVVGLVATRRGVPTVVLGRPLGTTLWGSEGKSLGRNFVDRTTKS